jgi:phosphatidylinositol-3-phosphatase
MPKYIAILFAVVLLVSACQPATPTPTPPPVITDTPTSTLPVTPTSTPSATKTATSTSTLTPTLTSTLPDVTPSLTSTPTHTATASPTATLTNTAPPPPTATFTPTPDLGLIKHIFVVMMENHSYEDIWGSASAPYINSLGSQYARATNYHAVLHPSLPNYIAFFSGSNYGITTDCSPSSSCHVNAPHLGDRLDAKGLSWKVYMEAMPAPCYLVNDSPYAVRHNPLVYFDNIRNDPLRCAAHDVLYSALPTDLLTAATTPNFAFIAPDVCHDMHDCSISQGDDWLKANLPPILSSPACTSESCLLVLLWDEDDNHQANHVLTIFAGSAARTGGATSDAAYTHYSLLRTIEGIFDLPTLTSNDAAAAPMYDLLNPAPPG